eukprot:scaffold7226_cov55-Phaeocystis_antarctica.AAC.2
MRSRTRVTVTLPAALAATDGRPARRTVRAAEREQHTREHPHAQDGHVRPSQPRLDTILADLVKEPIVKDRGYTRCTIFRWSALPFEHACF